MNISRKNIISLIAVVLCITIKVSDATQYRFPIKGRSQVTNIAFGDFAKPGELKYQVALLAIVERIYYKQFCGGAIISSRHVLSAAHCVRGKTSEEVIIRAGVNNYEDNRNAQDRRVSSWTTHPKEDIALINLEEPYILNNFLQPIPLATKLPSVGTRCVVSGWGMRGTSGNDNMTFLKKAENRIGLQFGPKSMILAFEGSLTTGWTCLGDSGGPLACNGELAGVVQWMLVDKRQVQRDQSYCPRALRGYGNVFYFVPWLKENGFESHLQ